MYYKRNIAKHLALASNKAINQTWGPGSVSIST